jgi:ABC-type phosphate transport system permease subunit
MTEKEDRATAARAAYLQNQQAVVASAKARRGLSPFVIVSLIGALLTLGFYIASVVSYYNDPQEQGPGDITLPTLTSIAFMATIYSLVLPYLLEARAVAARVRNLVLAAVPSVILTLFGIAIFIDLGSLVADLIYNLGH